MDRRPGMVLRMAWLFFYAKIQDGLKNLWMLLDLQVFGKKVFSAGLFRVFGTKYQSDAFSISVSLTVLSQCRHHWLAASPLCAWVPVAIQRQLYRGVVVFFDSRISKTGIHSSHQIMKNVTIQ